MSKPKRTSPAGRRGLGKNTTCPGRRADYTVPALPASARFDSDGLLIPCPRSMLTANDADAVAAVIKGCGLLNDDPSNSCPYGWRTYRRKWFVAYRGKTYRASRDDVNAWLSELLSKCLTVDCAGRLRPFLVLRVNVSAVRCSLGRALAVREDLTPHSVNFGLRELSHD